jgi:hypothetical protein
VKSEVMEHRERKGEWHWMRRCKKEGTETREKKEST